MVGSGEESLRALEKRHGTLPVTVVVGTARGRHLYFRYGGDVIPNSAAKLGPGLDVRGDGGYVVGAQSDHASGHRYEYAEGLSPKTVSIARSSGVARSPDRPWLCRRFAGFARAGPAGTSETCRSVR